MRTRIIQPTFLISFEYFFILQIGRSADIESMKIAIALLLGFGSLLGGEYWIQVLCINKESSVDAAFLERLGSTGHRFEVVNEGQFKKVLVGSYESEIAALKQLPELRCRYRSDAFVRSYTPQEGKVKKPDTAEPVETVEVADIAETMVPMDAAGQKTEEECICLCTKQGRRKFELSKIMEFYKNSSDYRFTQ